VVFEGEQAFVWPVISLIQSSYCRPVELGRTELLEVRQRPVLNKPRFRERRDGHFHLSALINFFFDALSATEHGVYLEPCLSWRRPTQQEDAASERIEIRSRV
jgi:hypothetical protein